MIDHLLSELAKLPLATKPDDVLSMSVEQAFYEAVNACVPDLTGVALNLYGNQGHYFDCDGGLELEYGFTPGQVLTAAEIVEIWHELGHLQQYRDQGDLYQLPPAEWELVSMQFEQKCLDYYGIQLDQSRTEELRRLIAVAIFDQVVSCDAPGKGYFKTLLEVGRLTGIRINEQEIAHVFNGIYRHNFYCYAFGRLALRPDYRTPTTWKQTNEDSTPSVTSMTSSAG